MKKTTKLLSLLVALSSLVVVALAAPVSAQQTNTSNGLRISPVRTDIVINAGSTQVVQIYVQNVTSQPVTLKGVANDFIASTDESGTPRLILDDNQFAPSHSLKRYVAPIHDVMLQPNEQKIVPVSISIPKDAAGGGYYGAIRFVPASSSSSENVTLTASVGSIVLVKVPGNIKEQVTLAGLAIHQNYTAQNQGSTRTVFTTNKNLSLVARFQNEGNLQEEPFGKVVLKKGKTTLQSVEINNTTPRGNVLPDSIRRFNVPLNKVGSFGKYTVEGNFGYGSAGQLITGKTTFYVIPMAAIITVVLVIVVILLAIFVLPRTIRAYNRRVISRASRGRNK